MTDLHNKNLMQLVPRTQQSDNLVYELLSRHTYGKVTQYTTAQWLKPIERPAKRARTNGQANAVNPAAISNAVAAQPKRRGRPPKKDKQIAKTGTVSKNNNQNEQRVAIWKGEFYPSDSIRAQQMNLEAWKSKLSAQRSQAVQNFAKPTKEPIARAYKKTQNLQTQKARKMKKEAEKKTQERALQNTVNNNELVPFIKPVRPATFAQLPKITGYTIPLRTSQLSDSSSDDDTAPVAKKTGNVKKRVLPARIAQAVMPFSHNMPLRPWQTFSLDTESKASSVHPPTNTLQSKTWQQEQFRKNQRNKPVPQSLQLSESSSDSSSSSGSSSDNNSASSSGSDSDSDTDTDTDSASD